MKKALVTGGAGFIGSHLCEELLDKDYKVFCLDNLYTGSKENIRDFLKNPNFIFVKGDVRNEKILSDLIKQIDIVYHLAAIVGVEEVIRNPIENISVNIEGTKILAESAFKFKKKIVFTSSSEVYGKNTQVLLKEDVSESIFGTTMVNRWAYGMSKAIGEHILFGYAEKGLKMSIVRYFNSYGPRCINQKYSNVIPKFIKQALNNKDLTVYGKGNQTRCFCYIKDTVEGTILAGEKRNALSQVINIGSNKEIKIKDLAKLIISLTKSDSKIKYVDEDRVFDKKFESSKRRVPSLTKAKKLLGFKPKGSLGEGLHETIGWFKAKEVLS